MAGKGIKNTAEKASILGAIAGAQHVRLMAKHYGVPVVLHSDHCAKKLLPWFDGMIEANEAYFKVSNKKIWFICSFQNKITYSIRIRFFRLYFNIASGTW